MWESLESIKSLDKEETTFRCRFQNLTKLITAVNIHKSAIDFEAGTSIGSPSKWKLEFTVEASRMYLQLRSVNLGGGIRLTTPIAKCEATVKSRANPNGDFDSTEVTSTSGRVCLWSLHQLWAEALLTDDELVVHLKFRLILDNLSNPSMTRQMMEHSLVELSTNFGLLLETGTNSDFVIQVKNSGGNVMEMKVHKTVLQARSPVLRQMFESGMTETTNGSMLIEDFTPECIHLVIKWIYTGILDEGWKKVPEEIVIAADKYDLPSLRSYLDKFLHHACTLKNSIRLRKVTKLYGLGVATENVKEFIRANMEEIMDLD